MRRHLTLLGSTAAGALLLAACGGDDAAPASTPDATPAATTGAAALPDDTGTDPTAGGAGTGEEPGAGSGADFGADIVDVDGTQVGTLAAVETDAGMELTVEVSGLPPGFKGLHLHTVGLCELESSPPDDPGSETGAFLSAGGHLGIEDDEHPSHRGDLPSLLVTEAGTASLVAVTDRVTVADLTDDDGAAVIVHSGPDNFANIPERYAPDGPDQDTLDTGDSGDRIACGVLE